MRQLLMLAAVVGLALARPEMYREKEDFQFSRSSTDEGSKSGYYGAQRGNMGGNYEKAHNMDSLAQNQMSGLVRTVEGELGDGGKQNSGSVFSSANSRGIYGSAGHYDLSNLQGRNFQEGETHSSRSHSSSTSHHSSGSTGQYSTSSNAGYGSNQHLNTGYGSQTHDSRYGGYSSAGNSEQALYNNRDHQLSDNLQSVSQYEDRNSALNSGYTAHNSGYYSQAAGYQGQVYDQGRTLTQNSDGSDIHTRLVSGKPVRISIRPGTKVIVPVAAQTYDASQSASSFDQNAINSETEVLNGNDQLAVGKPKTKHYESSYSYRKEWEKHGIQPNSGNVPVLPSVNPLTVPVNSELYEDAQRRSGQHRLSASEIASQTQHSGSHHSEYNVNAASSSQSRQADYNAHLYSSGANTGSSVYKGAYNGGSNTAYGLDASANNRRLTSGAYTGANNGASNINQIDDSNTKPKSYQSSYSYRKSWERQGDPYIIQPSSNGLYNGEASGKLTAASLNQGYGSSHQYGSHLHSHQSYGSNSNADCDENGHLRVARSPHSHHHHAQTRGDVVGQDDLGQQVQQQWGDIEQFGQQTQTQWDKIEDLGQQTQNTWDQLGQQTETKWDKLQDESQQTQTLWGQQDNQKEDKIVDFGQQTQNQWDQQHVGQQTQNTWDQDIQQTDLGQQTQDTWTTLDSKPIENHVTSNQTEQQSSGFDSSSQHNHGMNHQFNENTFEIAQTSNDQKINTESHTLETGTNKSSNHPVHNIWDEIKREEIGQENEADLAQTTDFGHQTNTMWGGINVNENSFQNQETGKVQDGSSNTFLDMPNSHPWMYNQVHHHHEMNTNSFNHSSSSSSFSTSHSHSWQQENSTSTNSNNFNSNAQTHSASGTSIMGLWDKLDSMEKQTIISKGNDDHYVGQQGTTNVQHSIFDSHNTDKHVDGVVNIDHHNVYVSNTTDNKLFRNNTVSITRPSTETTNKNSQPHNIGRGDIESDESPSEQIKPDNSKPNKTPDEIETLSLTKETDHVVQDNKSKEKESDLSVMSLDQQAHSENQDIEQSRSESGVSITNTNTQNTNYHHMHQNENMHHNEETTFNMEQQFENQAHQNLDLDHPFVNGQEDQQNTDQQFVDFGQKSENLGVEQREQQFETQNIGQIDSIQHNKNHEVEELGQKNEQFDQVSLSGWKPDDNYEQHEHKLENWGQTNENLEQQSQSGWAENMDDQEVQSEWRPSEGFEQHSQLSDTFEHPMEDLNQQVQTGRKTTDFVQHSQLTESFAQPKKDLDQQVQTAWKPTKDLQNSQVPDVSAEIEQNKESHPANNNKPEVAEEIIVPKKVNVVHSAPEEETVTEKPGFWKSIGSKFTSAKDKVSSWFSS